LEDQIPENHLLRQIDRHVLSGHFKTGQRWSPENRPTEVAGTEVVLTRRLCSRQVCFCAPTPWTTLQHVAMME
jgi:hypothetical protein